MIKILAFILSGFKKILKLKQVKRTCSFKKEFHVNINTDDKDKISQFNVKFIFFHMLFLRDDK